MAEKKQIPLRLSAKLYDAIAAWAEDDFRSVNGQIEYLLTECVKQRKKNGNTFPKNWIKVSTWISERDPNRAVFRLQSKTDAPYSGFKKMRKLSQNMRQLPFFLRGSGQLSFTVP